MKFFETSTFSKKFKASNIVLTFENGEPVFSAIVCISIRTEEAIKKGSYEKEYTSKDLEKILKLKEVENEWWKVGIKKGYISLYYYPMVHQRKYYPKKSINSICENLGTVVGLFTAMVKGLK